MDNITRNSSIEDTAVLIESLLIGLVVINGLTLIAIIVGLAYLFRQKRQFFTNQELTQENPSRISSAYADTRAYHGRVR